MKYYVNEKLKNISCEKLPISEFASIEEIKKLIDEGKINNPLSVIYSLAIGFANGFSFKNKKNDMQFFNFQRPIIEIPRASEKTIKTLIDMGIIYIGEDNEKHVNEIIPTQPTKAE